MNILKQWLNYFKREKSCNCITLDDHDPHVGKKFKHYANGKLYRYLFSATNNDSLKEDLVVVYENVESGKRYIRKWNNFFSTTLREGKTVARFEEWGNKS